MKQEYYHEEMMVKEAIAQQKNDQEIGMPDIEEELKRVKMMAKKNQPSLVRWRRIAALFTLVLSISGLSWAIAYYHEYHSGDAQVEDQQINTKTATSEVTKLSEEEEEVKVSEELTLSYEKASLLQIVVDLTAFYQLEKPVFKDKEAASNFMMHITLNPEATIQEAVELLNHFGNVDIILEENKLVVK